MSPLAKTLTNGAITLAVGMVLFFAGRLSTARDDINNQLDEKNKQDIAKMITEQLKPIIEDKLPIKEFDNYKVAHDAQYEADKKLFDERNTNLINNMNKIANDMTQANKEAAANNRLMNKMINDILRFQKSNQ